MLELLDENLWALSAAMNIILSMTAVALGIRLTQGAGFKCPAALIRWVQRLAFLVLAAALTNSALHAIQIRQAPPLYAALIQLSFIAVLLTSAVRHLSSPPIPSGSSWKHRMRQTAHIERLGR